MDSDFKIGDKVKVNDDSRKFLGTVTGPNPKNSAEFEVTDEKGRTFTVHWAWMRKA